MNFKATKMELSVTLDGKARITFEADKAVLSDLEALSGELSVKVERYSNPRSLTQNSYMWVLIGELSKKLTLSKDEVYKTYIKDYGSYEILPISEKAVDAFQRKWASNGLGWFSEDLGESKLNGYRKIIAYYGSSSYDRREMGNLLDAVIRDCEEQGIPTLTEEQLMKLKNQNEKP